MELTFNQTDKGWVAEFEAATHFNLHLEREQSGRLDLYKRSAGTSWEYVGKPYLAGKRVVDFDVPVVVGKMYKVVLSELPTMMIVTFADGTQLEAEMPEQGGSEFVSIRELYQPTTEDVDINTGYFDGVTNCDKVTEIEVLGLSTYEEVDSSSMGLMNTSKSAVASVNIRTTRIDTRLLWGMESVTDGLLSGVIYTITPDNVVTRNDEEISKFNAILAGDDFRYAIANAGVPFTEEQFDIFDKFIKVKTE